MSRGKSHGQIDIWKRLDPPPALPKRELAHRRSRDLSGITYRRRGSRGPAAVPHRANSDPVRIYVRDVIHSLKSPADSLGEGKFNLLRRNSPLHHSTAVCNENQREPLFLCRLTSSRQDNELRRGLGHPEEIRVELQR